MVSDYTWQHHGQRGKESLVYLLQNHYIEEQSFSTVHHSDFFICASRSNRPFSFHKAICILPSSDRLTPESRSLRPRSIDKYNMPSQKTTITSMIRPRLRSYARFSCAWLPNNTAQLSVVVLRPSLETPVHFSISVFLPRFRSHFWDLKMIPIIA